MTDEEKLNKIFQKSQEVFIQNFSKKFKGVMVAYFNFCLEKDDISKYIIIRFFHTIKGTGATLNFEKLSIIGENLENYLNTKESFDYEIFLKIAKGLALTLSEFKKIQANFSENTTDKLEENTKEQSAKSSTIDLNVEPKNNPYIQIDTQSDDNSNIKEKSLLLIDDDLAICNLLKEVFKEIYNFSYAESGELGIELFFKNKPDIVIVDLVLPKSNGFEVCKKIRAYSPSKDTKLIVLSSKNNEDTLITSFELGIDDFLPKPFNVDELLIRIKRLFD